MMIPSTPCPMSERVFLFPACSDKCWRCCTGNGYRWPSIYVFQHRGVTFSARFTVPIFFPSRPHNRSLCSLRSYQLVLRHYYSHDDSSSRGVIRLFVCMETILFCSPYLYLLDHLISSSLPLCHAGQGPMLERGRHVDADSARRCTPPRPKRSSHRRPTLCRLPSRHIRRSGFAPTFPSQRSLLTRLPRQVCTERVFVCI